MGIGAGRREGGMQSMQGGVGVGQPGRAAWARASRANLLVGRPILFHAMQGAVGVAAPQGTMG